MLLAERRKRGKKKREEKEEEDEKCSFRNCVFFSSFSLPLPFSVVALCYKKYPRVAGPAEEGENRKSIFRTNISDLSFEATLVL